MTPSTAAAGVLPAAPVTVPIDPVRIAPASDPIVPRRRAGSQPRRRLRIARAAVASLFFLDGLGMASWVVRIPAVQRALGLSAGTLGLALLGTAVGGLIAMPVVGMLVSRRGSKPVARWAALAFTGALILPPLAPSLPLLCAALVLLGAVTGALGVAINAQAVTVERTYARPIMTSFHAFFSLGGLTGAVLGGFVAEAGIAPVTHLAVTAVVLAALALGVAPALLPAGADAAPGGAPFARPTRALLALGTIAFCVLFGEGAMADWTAVYLRDVADATPGLAAAGFAAFSLMMAAGRFVGDRLTARLGRRRLGLLGGAVVAAGVTFALLVPHPWAAAIGFGAVGAGLSSLFPASLTAAGRLAASTNTAPATSIAAVSMLGNLGFLAGPPLIGLAAELLTLRVALGAVAVAGVVITLLAGSLREGPAAKVAAAA